MYINGLSYLSRSFDDVLSAVMALDSGFSVRTNRRTDDARYVRSEAHALANEGSVFLSKWQREKDANDFEQAKNYYKRSLISADASKDHLIRAITYARYAEVAPIFGGDVALIFHLLLTATQLARQFDANDFASQFATKFHENLYRVIRSGIEQGLTSEEINPWLIELQRARRQASKLFRNQRGELVDEAAYRVEQGEVGYTIDQRIGTDSLAQCISPIMQNTDTKMTALAHIDFGCDVGSIDDVLRRLGYDGSGPPISLRLVGGNNANTSSNDAVNQKMASNATNNVVRLLTHLQKRNINIISSDILDGEQPISVVVDPHNFSLHEAVPGKENPDFFLAQGRALLFYGEGRPLFDAFDLSKSVDRNPIYINHRLVQALHPMSKFSIEQLYDMCVKGDGMVDAIVGEQVEAVKSLASEFRKAVVVRIGKVSERLDELQEQGFVFDDPSIKRIVTAVSELPVFVGKQSGGMNLPLLSFLRHDFIRVINNGNNLWVDAGGLSQFYQRQTTVQRDGPN